MLLGHPGVVRLCPWHAIVHSVAEQLFYGTLIKQFFDGILIQTPSYAATLLSDPCTYSISKLYPAIAATHLCPMASKLGVDMT